MQDRRLVALNEVDGLLAVEPGVIKDVHQAVGIIIAPDDGEDKRKDKAEKERVAYDAQATHVRNISKNLTIIINEMRLEAIGLQQFECDNKKKKFGIAFDEFCNYFLIKEWNRLQTQREWNLIDRGNSEYRNAFINMMCHLRKATLVLPEKISPKYSMEIYQLFESKVNIFFDMAETRRKSEREFKINSVICSALLLGLIAGMVVMSSGVALIPLLIGAGIWAALVPAGHFGFKHMRAIANRENAKIDRIREDARHNLLVAYADICGVKLPAVCVQEEAAGQNNSNPARFGCVVQSSR